MIGNWGIFVYWFAVLGLRFWAKLLFRKRTIGIRNIPQGECIIASNHVSHLDPPLVGIGVPRIVLNMAKKELFEKPFLLWFLKTIGTIIVDRGRGAQALEEAIDRLNSGACMVIFPEGTRSKDGRLSRGRSGAVVMAIRSGAPIVPAAIRGSELALTKGSKMIKFVKVTVQYSEPYYVDYQGDPEDIPRDVLRRETYRLMMKIEALLPEHMKTPDELREKWYGKWMVEDGSLTTTP